MIIAVVIPLVIYPHQILLSGDQIPQVQAAISMLEGKGLLIPLHWTKLQDIWYEIPHSQTQMMTWYPPGYSCILRWIAPWTSSLVNAAFLIFFLNKALGYYCWLQWSKTVGIPFRWIFPLLIFFSVLFIPSTTTDQISMTILGALFWLWNTKLVVRQKAIGMGILIFSSLLFRYATVGWLPAIFGFIVLSRYTLREKFTLSLALVPTVIGYWGWTHLFLKGSPYPLVSSANETNWILLWKGIYFAVGGGWSPDTILLKGLYLLFVALIVISLICLFKKESIPDWILQTVIFQGAVFGFLVTVQIFKGGMYSLAEPSFATARFYMLPFISCGCISFWVLEKTIQSYRKQLYFSAILFLGVCGFLRFKANTELMHQDLKLAPNGFLMPRESSDLAWLVEERKPDMVIQKGDVYCTAIQNRDQQLVLPYKISIEKPCRILLVIQKDDPLLIQLKSVFDRSSKQIEAWTFEGHMAWEYEFSGPQKLVF